MSRSRSQLTLLLLAASVVSGCHRYVPMSYQDLAPGLEVRARVTGAFADSIDAILFRDARVFEGTVVENRAGAVLVEVPVTQNMSGMRFQTLSQRIEVPEAVLVDLELKELDRTRTWGAAAIVGGVMTAVVIAQINARSGGSSLPGGGGPVEALIPIALLRLPIH